MSLVLAEDDIGVLSIGVQPRHDEPITTDGAAYRMACYLLAAARHPPSWKRDLPPVGSIELLQLNAGRLVRVPIR